jgi:hypothetical protein
MIGTKLKGMIESVGAVYELDQKRITNPMKEMVDLLLQSCGQAHCEEKVFASTPVEDSEDEDDSDELPIGYKRLVGKLRLKYGDDWQDKMNSKEKEAIIEEVRKSM